MPSHTIFYLSHSDFHIGAKGESSIIAVASNDICMLDDLQIKNIDDQRSRKQDIDQMLI